MRGRMDSSRFRGVTRLKAGRQPWQAEIKIDGVRRCLGRFCDEESAARAYDDALRAAQTVKQKTGDQGAENVPKRRWKEFNFPKKGERAVGTSESSRYRGVTRTGAGVWQAKIRDSATIRYLGQFNDEKAAARAFDKAATALRGRKAKTNFGHDARAAAAVYDCKRKPGTSTAHAEGDGAGSERPHQAGLAVATLLQPRERIDYKFEVGDAGTSRWFPGTFVRYKDNSGSNGGKKRGRGVDYGWGDMCAGCRGGGRKHLCGKKQKPGSTRYSIQKATTRPRRPGGAMLASWGLVAFDDGKTLLVRLQPNCEGTLWRRHSSRTYGSEELRTSVFASAAVNRMMRVKQWQTDATDEPMIDSRRTLPIYTASSSIDCSPNGFGCFAATALTKGQFIAEYAGEIICDDERERKRRRHSQYIFDLGDGLAVDAVPKGNPTRRINHSSSSPNTRAVIANHRGVRKVCVYATKEIAANTELCFDYGAKFWACKA